MIAKEIVRYTAMYFSNIGHNKETMHIQNE